MDIREGIVDWLLAFGVGGVVIEALRAFVQRRKMGADYADVIASSAIKLLMPLEDRVKELEQEQLAYLRKLEEHQTELRDTKRKLILTQAELREARNEIRRLSLKIIEYERNNPNE